MLALHQCFSLIKFENLLKTEQWFSISYEDKSMQKNL